MENFQLNKFQIILIIFVSVVIFLFIYSPSFSTPFPKHIDEWIHINQALNLGRGEYQWQSLPTFSLGFHFLLYGISQVVDLVQIYKFLAPAWAVLSALVLFFITYKLSGQDFLIAFLSMIFFGSIKSNVNLLGLYFFTPLTFAIPFIFLFIFFFVRGLEKENKKYLILSFLIMLLLIPVHAISVTFAFPILIFSGILYYKYIKKELWFFLVFLLIPLLGLIFFSFVKNVTIIESLGILVKELSFIKEWGGAKFLNDSLTTTYSIIGGILASIGFLVILWSKKRYLYPYIAWPLYLFLMILIVRIIDYSYLAPYHRNFYYFTISLPLLSAFGLNWVINLLASKFIMVNFKLVAVSILIIAVFFSFISYNKEYSGRPSYIEIINDKDYKDLVFLSEFPEGKVLTYKPLVWAVSSVTNHKTIEDFSFDRFIIKHINEFFFSEDNCDYMNAMLRIYKVNYVISIHELSCGYKLLRSEHNYIYQVSD